MKNLLFLFAAALVIFTTSCGNDEGSLELNFVNTYEGEPIVLGDAYQFNDNVNIQFDKIRYFVANVQLMDGGTATELVDVDYLNFEDSATPDLASAGKTLIINDIEAKSYDGIEMNIGLTQTQNDSKREDVPAASPLNDGNYWAPWESYIFITLEMRADLDNDDIFEHNLVYHMGGNQAIRTKSFSKEVDVMDGKTTTLNFELDIKDVLIQNGQEFDIFNITAVHTDKDIMEELADKVQAAFKLN